MKDFPETVVVCLLKAMKLDSVEARQRFPRLLQIVEQYPDLKGIFISKVSVKECIVSILTDAIMPGQFKCNNVLLVHTFT